MQRDIRFLVTNACNYNCYFCHHEGETGSNFIRNELSVEDYLNLYKIYSDMENWNGITISGGEPLLYRNIIELCKKLHYAGGKITIVTNGYLLMDKIDLLKYVDRINISIHTLNEQKYNEIVGLENVFGKVIHGLKMVRKLYPDLEIRLNITPTVNNWSAELLKEILGFSKELKASVKFTELFPNTESDCIPVGR